MNLLFTLSDTLLLLLKCTPFVISCQGLRRQTSLSTSSGTKVFGVFYKIVEAFFNRESCWEDEDAFKGGKISMGSGI